jgi:hypothetical protein
VTASSWSPGDDSPDATPENNDHGAELRTYTLTDLAGNTTTLVLKVQLPGPHGHQLKARLVSVQYGSTPVVTFGSNSEQFHWDLATLLDEGRYVCSVPAMYRVLRATDEVHERRRQARHPATVKPEPGGHRSEQRVELGISPTSWDLRSGPISTCT